MKREKQSGTSTVTTLRAVSLREEGEIFGFGADAKGGGNFADKTMGRMYKKEERKVEWVAASERERIPMKGKAIRLCAQEIRKFRRGRRRVASNFRPLEGRATFYLCIN